MIGVMGLTSAERDRAAGCLLATACGDALGAGYEFGPPLSAETAVTMCGGGAFGWEPGEWTDDTAMALVIADALADRAAADRFGRVVGAGNAAKTDPIDDAVLTRMADGWYRWSLTAPDVGNQTRAVLEAAWDTAQADGRNGVIPMDLVDATQAHHERTGRSAGNGSLMRTAPVALAYLADGWEAELVAAAVRVSGLTHFDTDASEACALWCVAIRHAVRTGEIDVRAGLPWLEASAARRWEARIEVAERSAPRDFAHNGWVVEALQAAWSAIHGTRAAGAGDPLRRPHLQHALEAAVRGGDDTDTVAAIAGGLVGAACGESAIPDQWRQDVHGWPGRRAGDLVDVALRITGGGAFGAEL